jgi:multidrug efflux system outer membrane protein
MTSPRKKTAFSIALTLCLLAGCTVGPAYHRPAAETPAAFKELTPSDFSKTEGWKVAQPRDDALRGKWWEIFNDPH